MSKKLHNKRRVMKKKLSELLPRVVWIGPRLFCQPAFLDLSKNIIEYAMSNESPKPLPDRTSDNDVFLYFESWENFQDWVDQINLFYEKLSQGCLKLKNAQEIQKTCTKLWPFFEIKEIPEYKQQNFSFRSKSISFFCKTFVDEFCLQVDKNCDQLCKFLKTNKFLLVGESFCDKDIVEIAQSRIQQFEKIDYVQKYKPILQKHCKKFDKFDDVCSILNLSKRTNTTFIAAKKYLYEKYQRMKMRDRWAEK